MKNIITMVILVSSFLMALIAQRKIKKEATIRPVENEEIFDHLFIE